MEKERTTTQSMMKKKQRQQEKFTDKFTNPSTLVLNQSPSSIHPSTHPSLPSSSSSSSFFFVKSSLIDDCSHQSGARSTTPPHTQLTADCIIAPRPSFRLLPSHRAVCCVCVLRVVVWWCGLWLAVATFWPPAVPHASLATCTLILTHLSPPSTRHHTYL